MLEHFMHHKNLKR